jgi:hypothetical protein
MIRVIRAIRTDFRDRHAISRQIFFHPTIFFLRPIRAFNLRRALHARTARRTGNRRFEIVFIKRNRILRTHD